MRCYDVLLSKEFDDIAVVRASAAPPRTASVRACHDVHRMRLGARQHRTRPAVPRPRRVTEIPIDGAEERILALLAVAYGNGRQPRHSRQAAPRRTILALRGSNHLAAIEIALTGLPPFEIRRNSARLSFGEKLLAKVLTRAN